MVRVVILSDTHNRHRQVQVPECDLLIHCGDSTERGTPAECFSFENWFLELPVKHKVYIAGNHDFMYQKVHVEKFREWNGTKMYYLEDSSVTIEGLKIYGTPWTPFFCDWAFNGLEERPPEGYSYRGGPGKCEPDRQHPLLSERYALIPDDTQVLICHGPPRIGELDLCPTGTNKPGLYGSSELLKRINQLDKLKLGCFGHFHSGYGVLRHHEKILVNAALMDESYTLCRQPIVIDLK